MSLLALYINDWAFHASSATLTFGRSLKYSNSHRSGLKQLSCSSEALTHKREPLLHSGNYRNTHLWKHPAVSIGHSSVCAPVSLPGRYCTALQTSAYPEADRKLLNRRRETVALWTCAKVNKPGPFFSQKRAKGGFPKCSERTEEQLWLWKHTL